jgi:SAM-dependent methyltransferase
MNFNRRAAHYHWLEHVFAGGLMQRCRTTFLEYTWDRRHALLVGEGTGRFLLELLRVNPQLHVLCLEQSRGMIEQARQRVAGHGLDLSRVEFRQMDALTWTPAETQFDLIVTNFFRADQLELLIPRLAGSTTRDAVWLLADFRVPERGWRRWRAQLILANLYAFFKLSTSLSTTWLTPPDALLRRAGFDLADRRCMNFGLAHADLWQRKHP